MAAAAGRDGGHEQTGSSSHSNSSCSSGTVVSTTNTSSASRPSPASMEAALPLGLEIQDDENMSWEETEEGKVKRIKSLVQEFFGATSANCSVDMSVLGRWLTELGVGWVLHLASAASAGELLDHASDARNWIRALKEIVDLLPGIFEEEEEGEEEPEAAESSALDQLQFARFIQETMLKMLAFVDAIVALYPREVAALRRKINVLLLVRGALSDALSQLEVSFPPRPSPQVERILGEMFSLLSVKQGDAREAIWSTLKEIRFRILESTDDSSGAHTTQGLSGIHKVTLSVMRHIKFLLHNYSSVYPILIEATSLGNYVPRIGDLSHLDSMIVEMASCLQEKLVNMSASFPDQGRRFLFLLNNSYFIRDELLQYSTRHSSLQVHVAALSGRVEGYMESYLQVSWAPLLSCLYNPTPLCLFGKFYYPSALPKFESQFQKTCTTQKQWKVPDPELRRSLRTAITEKIVPCYTKYIEDNNSTTPRIAPKEMEEKLQELFEG